MYKLILILFTSFLFCDNIRKCGTIASQEMIRESSIEYRNYLNNYNEGSRELYWVPVQFHIIQHSDGSGGLNAMIFPGIIDDLNLDFINANIRFYQYGEIDFILNSDYYSTDGDAEINEVREINNVENVIDIYAIPNLSSDNGPICGKSSFTSSGIQGIVVDNGCFDRFTVNHEVGHYFDLYHPHENYNGDEYVNGYQCETRGDGICDTPADPKLNEDGMVNECNYTGTATDPNGQEYDDCQGYPPCEYYGGPDIGNIMSYAPDNCVNHFTEEQYQKVEFVLTNIRENYIQDPNYVEFELNNFFIYDVEGDGDLVINPGESVELILEIGIDENWPANASDVILNILSNEDDVNILNDQDYIIGLNPGENYQNNDNPFLIQFSNDAILKDYEFILSLSYISENGNTYSSEFVINLEVSHNQFGFPYETGSTVESSPIIIDIDSDGVKEIIFGDYSGNLNICEPIMDNCIVFNTGGQIWGSPAVHDIDNDDEFEIVISSVDKYIYILNSQGELEASYYTDQFLVGTPAIGNLDDDPEFEIVIGGYTNNGQIFVINHDGSDVENFPITINEKMKNGAGLADVDNDGKEEIFIGTESNNLYRINPNGTIYNNTPILIAEDKIKFDPVIVGYNNNFQIFVGSTDNNLYSISPNGNINFVYETNDDVLSSASAVALPEQNFGILFSSEDGNIYFINSNGENMPGWPQYSGYNYNSTPIISDLDCNGIPDIIATGSSFIQTFQFNGEEYSPPIDLVQTVKGSPYVMDFDDDGDLEIFSGTNFNLFGVDGDYPCSDVEEINYSMFRVNKKRNGFLNFDLLKIELNITPISFETIKIYPNPFNPNFTLEINIGKIGIYEFNIYDINGRIVKKTIQSIDNIGLNLINFDLSGMSSGSYFISCKYELKTSQIIPIILLK